MERKRKRRGLSYLFILIFLEQCLSIHSAPPSTNSTGNHSIGIIEDVTNKTDFVNQDIDTSGMNNETNIYKVFAPVSGIKWIFSLGQSVSVLTGLVSSIYSLFEGEESTNAGRRFPEGEISTTELPVTTQEDLSVGTVSITTVEKTEKETEVTTSIPIVMTQFKKEDIGSGEPTEIMTTELKLNLTEFTTATTEVIQAPVTVISKPEEKQTEVPVATTELTKDINKTSKVKIEVTENVTSQPMITVADIFDLTTISFLIATPETEREVTTKVASDVIELTEEAVASVKFPETTTSSGFLIDKGIMTTSSRELKDTTVTTAKGQLATIEGFTVLATDQAREITSSLPEKHEIVFEISEATTTAASLKDSSPDIVSEKEEQPIREEKITTGKPVSIEGSNVTFSSTAIKDEMVTTTVGPEKIEFSTSTTTIFGNTLAPTNSFSFKAGKTKDQVNNVSLAEDKADTRTFSQIAGSSETFVRPGQCITSGGRKPNIPCVFPFTSRGKTYYSCTWDVSYVTGNKPWCSTKVDDFGNHIRGNWGNCDLEHCPGKVPPRECGVPIRRRRGRLVTDPNSEVGIDRLPWMASLGHYSEGEWNHQCGGSLITNRHVLTAAHCFNVVDLEGYRMRLGNANLKVESRIRTLVNPRGFEEFGNINELDEDEKKKKDDPSEADHEIERAIIRVMTHPKYRQEIAYFDVGIAVADRIIEFTDYVRPVCLPFRPVDDEDDLENDLVTLAGWGYDFVDDKVVLTNKLAQAKLQVYSRNFCDRIFSREGLARIGISHYKLQQQLPKGMTKDIVCIGSDIVIEGACEGDSGSPAIRRVTNTAREDPYYEQVFMVTGGVSCTLGATIYSKIADREVITWIQRQTDTTPLLMVVGGYNRDFPNGLVNDIELLSTKPGNACSKRIRPLNGRVFNISGQIEKESAIIGMVGQVTHDAIILCGGKNGDNNLRRCHQYDPKGNRWHYIEPMIDRRYLAASVLDERGNLWVLGGAHGSSAAESTEIYEFKKRVWRRAKPLPKELRDSGINSHCAVRVNKTHVLIAGGYASDYIFINPTFDADDDEEGIFIPGTPLKRAWLYDGLYWNRVEDMSEFRDRPACSLIQDPKEGKIRILVAGGCNGWCVKNPPIDSAEVFDPETGQWNPVAPLPKPLSSAKMELFNGYPTIIGGYDGENQSKSLYRYILDEDRWEELDLQLRIGRSSMAVLQVPHSMFPYC